MQPQDPADRRAPRLLRAHKWMLLVSSLSIALVISSMAALYTAMPEVAVATGATQEQLTWVVDGYTLALACLVLPAGALGDRYGRRGVLVIGLAIFAVASAVPLWVQDPVWLIGARSVAGVGAAFVMPSTLSILTTSFPVAQRGRAVGVWAGVAGSGGVLGIVGSGFLLEHWTWLSIFVGLTVGATVLLVAALTLPESWDTHRPAMDFVGAVWVALAIGAIVFAVIEAPARGWLDSLVIIPFIAGIAAAVFFVFVELRAEHPLLQLRYFTHRGFGSGALSITIQFVVTFGVFLLFVQYLQLIFGYSPLQAALAMAPMMIPLIAISVVAPGLADRVGLRLVTVTGMVLITVALVLVSRLTVAAGYPDLLWALLIMSTGLGLCTAPATFAIVAETPVDKHGVAAAVNDAAREIGAAIGIAAAGSILAAGYSDRIQPALPRLPAEAREPVSDSLAAALQVAEQAGPQAQPLAEFAKAAFVHGTEQASLVMAIVTAVGAVVLGVWAPGRATGQNDEDDIAKLSESDEVLN